MADHQRVRTISGLVAADDRNIGVQSVGGRRSSYEVPYGAGYLRLLVLRGRLSHLGPPSAQHQRHLVRRCTTGYMLEPRSQAKPLCGVQLELPA